MLAQHLLYQSILFKQCNCLHISLCCSEAVRIDTQCNEFGVAGYGRPQIITCSGLLSSGSDLKEAQQIDDGIRFKLNE